MIIEYNTFIFLIIAVLVYIAYQIFNELKKQELENRELEKDNSSILTSLLWSIVFGIISSIVTFLLVGSMLGWIMILNGRIDNHPLFRIYCQKINVL